MSAPRVGYVTLQSTREGQAAHAHVHGIVDGLRALGHEVTLFEPAYRSASPGIAARLAEFRRIARRVRARLDDIDVLYVRGHPLAAGIASSARAAGVAVVQECNGPYQDAVDAWPVAAPLAGLLASASRRQYATADAVVAVTDALAAWVRAETRRADVAVVPNGVDTERFTPLAPARSDLPRPYALMFGALQPWQGVRTALEAHAHPAWPASVTLVFAGDGALAGAIDEAARSRPGVLRLGTVPYDDMPGVVSGALCSLVCLEESRRGASGASPVKLYESMAAGVPVVAGDLPGLATDVTEAGCGIVVPPGDAAATAAAVAAIASGSEPWGARGRAAAEAHHTWTMRARATADVLTRALADARAHTRM